MFRIASLKSFGEKAMETVRRFPLPLLISSLAAVALIWLVDQRKGDAGFQSVFHFVMTASLALPAFTGLAFLLERYRLKKLNALFAHLLLGGICILYIFSLPEEFKDKDLATYFLLSISAHLGVSFAPFLVGDEIKGFWQYNKSLFLRFLTSALYSGVLFGGLALALLSVDHLFEADLNDKIYVRLWILIAAVFNTWFFLSDLPEDLPALERSDEYPSGLRVFTQFVLLPLVTIYLLILYVYGAKILITMHWPEGWVSYLVIGFSTAGILALLLVWPLRESAQYKWINAYARNFFRALFPLILLLAFSIFIRVRAYGITENRYFVMVLAAWLLLNAFYFLFSQRKHIRFIPLTLFLAALISGFGPWSAFSVSRKSQLNRLTAIADKYGMLQQDKIVPAVPGKLFASHDLVDMSSILSYLVRTHGAGSLQSFISLEMDSLVKKEGSYAVAGRVMHHWNLAYTYPGSVTSGSNNFNFSYNAYAEPLRVSGYDYYLTYSFWKDTNSEAKKYRPDSVIRLLVVMHDQNQKLSVQDDSGLLAELELSEVCNGLIRRYGENYSAVPLAEMSFTRKGKTGSCRFIIKQVAGKLNSKRELRYVHSLEADLLVRISPDVP
ncbi:MAG: DUF4153 domain-containing protein [Bacteroidia bacterium]|nr:DUF4153 domain-containing protein [Bacteroidia bacterium]